MISKLCVGPNFALSHQRLIGFNYPCPLRSKTARLFLGIALALLLKAGAVYGSPCGQRLVSFSAFLSMPKIPESVQGFAETTLFSRSFRLPLDSSELSELEGLARKAFEALRDSELEYPLCDLWLEACFQSQFPSATSGRPVDLIAFVHNLREWMRYRQEDFESLIDWAKQNRPNEFRMVTETRRPWNQFFDYLRGIHMAKRFPESILTEKVSSSPPEISPIRISYDTSVLKAHQDALPFNRRLGSIVHPSAAQILSALQHQTNHPHQVLQLPENSIELNRSKAKTRDLLEDIDRMSVLAFSKGLSAKEWTAYEDLQKLFRDLRVQNALRRVDPGFSKDLDPNILSDDRFLAQALMAGTQLFFTNDRGMFGSLKTQASGFFGKETRFQLNGYEFDAVDVRVETASGTKAMTIVYSSVERNSVTNSPYQPRERTP